MAEPLTKTRFTTLLAGRMIDLREVTRDERAQLAAAGINTLSDLVTPAVAYDALERIDKNGSALSIAEPVGETCVAKAWAVMNRHAKRITEQETQDTFISRGERGFIDPSALSADIRVLLKLDGLDEIRGAAAFAKLFRQLAALEKSSQSLILALDDQPTLTARVRQALLGAYQQYEQLPQCYPPDAIDAGALQQVYALDVPHLTQKTATSCLDTCLQMVNAFDASLTPSLRSRQRFTCATADDAGRLLATRDALQDGADYVERVLAAGRPVVVGVSHRHAPDLNQGITDHYVVIVGMSIDAEGRHVYEFLDPASSSADGRGLFRVDPSSGLLYEPATQSASEEARVYSPARREYQVSEVRLYEDMPLARECPLDQKTGASAP